MQTTIAKAELERATIQLDRVPLAGGRKMYNIYVNPNKKRSLEKPKREGTQDLNFALKYFAAEVARAERLATVR